MSNEKFKNIELENIISRMKDTLNLSYDGDIANILGVGKSLFSTKKKSGSLFVDIAIYCVENNLDLNWILKGEKPINIEIDDVKLFYQWLDTKSENREHALIWFRVDRKKNILEFIEWLEANENVTNCQDSVQAKIA